MPERYPPEDFEMTASTKAPAPVWSPNPGVPLVARLLAYTFGGLMLLTIFATCLTPRADDVPPIPSAETDWSSLDAGDGCILYYPRGWSAALQEGDAHPDKEGYQLEVNFSLYPNSPVQVMAILEDLPLNSEYLVIQQQNDWLEKKLLGQRHIRNFTLFDGVLTSISTNGQAFTFTLDNRPMSGAWLIQPKGRFLLSLIGFAPRKGWEATQIIISQMAEKAEFP
jgi:hypothetical protein